MEKGKWQDIVQQISKKYEWKEQQAKKNLLLYYLFELRLLFELKEEFADDTEIIASINDEIKNHNQFYILLNHRLKAKEKKDYELADNIRKEIQYAGIEIKDGKDRIIVNTSTGTPLIINYKC
jgi:cysteinyl-tRNA synthetase